MGSTPRTILGIGCCSEILKIDPFQRMLFSRLSTDAVKLAVSTESTRWNSPNKLRKSIQSFGEKGMLLLNPVEGGAHFVAVPLDP
jgi:hypothetical protein